MTTRLVKSRWDVDFREAVKSDDKSVKIICPFITLYGLKLLFEGIRPKEISVLTRYNLNDFFNGVSDIAALRFLLRKNASIKGIKDLHSKLYIIGNSNVILTSANITKKAIDDNVELGIMSNDNKIVSCCNEYFYNLWHEIKSDCLTDAKIDEWEEKLCELRSSKEVYSGPSLPDEGEYIPGINNTVSFPHEVAEAPQAFAKFFGTGNDRADQNNLIINEIHESDSYWACTYPQNKRPRQVQDGAVMYISRTVSNPSDIVVIGRGIAMKYQDGRDDATEEEMKLKPWKRTWPHYIRIYKSEFIKGRLIDGISLNELMNELDYNAFQTTQDNYNKGSGNKNPKYSIRQQPAVRLSPEGTEWLNNRLEKAFAVFGKITQVDIEKV